MDVSRIKDQMTMMQQVHPALDVVGDTLYVTVQARVSGKLQPVILTSDGELYSNDEWPDVCRSRGLLPLTDVGRAGDRPRWHSAGITEVMTSLQTTQMSVPKWKDVYAAIYTALAERLVLYDQRYLTVLTLFGMMTYFHPLFEFLPILHLRGPAESGKSRAGHALAGFAFNGAVKGSPTAATLFRHAHEGRYTQIIAESDHLATLTSGDRFVRQLQSACSKAEANVDVAEHARSGGYQPKTFFTFCPRVILSTTAIGSQPLRSRCIQLDLIKSPQPDQNALRRSVTDDEVWAPLRDQLYRLQLVRWREVRQAREEVKVTWVDAAAPTGRTFEKWLPLATMAALISPQVHDVVKVLAREDLLEQQQDGIDRAETRILRFALWLVRDGRDVAQSRNDLYTAFLHTHADDVVGDDTVVWAHEMGIPTSRNILRKAVSGPGVLVRELKRLKLTEEATHTNKGNRYLLRASHIRSMAESLIGSDEVQRTLAEHTTSSIPVL